MSIVKMSVVKIVVLLMAILISLLFVLSIGLHYEETKIGIEVCKENEMKHLSTTEVVITCLDNEGFERRFLMEEYIK